MPVDWSGRVGQAVRVRVPATSANLGPGFDALGLALALHDVVEARICPSGLSIEVSGEGASAAGAGEDHLVARAMRAAFGRIGGQPPGIALRCVNTIPHGRGLGSSAAAIVSGILAARALAAGGEDALPDDAVLALAAGLEGHPDNVAACLAGGLTVAWTSDGRVRSVRLSPLPGVLPVACISPSPLATEAARKVLPASVPHADAAANAGRSALLIAALTSDPGALLDATQDFLHQPYRAAVLPGTAELVSRLREAGIPAVVSGAGPSVLALLVSDPAAQVSDPAAQVSDPAAQAGEPAGSPVTRCHPGLYMIDSIARETGIPWHVSPLGIDRHGASIVPVAPGTPAAGSTPE